MFSEPQHNIELLELDAGMKVADLGSGSGFYSMSAASAVKQGGMVYAVDIQKDLLEKLKRGAQSKRLSNIEVVWGDIEKLGGTRLRDELVDAVLVCNILFQVEDKKSLVLEAKRILKKGGKVLVVDWTGSFEGTGPHQSHVFPKESAKELFESAGFHFERDIPAGENHYGLVFRKL
ncbi:MAG: methyltransferase domain-containing protein [bacterium]|nr:methyltransferase domain-containing protein [bacterium]